MASSPLLLILSAIVMQVTLNLAQQPGYRFHFCINTSYTAISTFPVNLNMTLSNLYVNATHSNGFYNTSTGQNPDKAYGLFHCRPYTSPELCRSCIKVASELITSLCPQQKEAITWYDECMLRFSNRSIFSDLEEIPKAYLWNVNDIKNSGGFNETMTGLMNSLVAQAVSSRKLFAAGVENDTIFSSIYGLVQCTPDISTRDCRTCLTRSLSDIPKCCNGKRGGRVLKPSCIIRYETFPFYNTTALLPPPPAPTLPPPPPGTSFAPMPPTPAASANYTGKPISFSSVR
ncbi:Cysteine-rich receptor-kinase-like protein [Quillaja saponaria]|uniref:Cysteine-rich receptor-kinase-like protein n=1 Tax=Quillaja saponaria TaxID=32244 RepID=A0AAD7M0H3_QUISA|nr:Cysteine-rich receptor-kinase-like protein [Quillaja saponaria]